ncbi:MAG TPA: hypothetical protein VE173_00670 [Longimicrobiales bacterium]|nr:hypothetical protein [Longimicrobiales bacterium]
MRGSLIATAVLAAGVSLSACASGGGRGPGQDRTRITTEEVRSAGVSNALQLVERLRPSWLRSHGERSINLETDIVVYQDNQMLGSVADLRLIPIDLVHSMRALSSSEAMILPGLGSRHVERAIIVETIYH